MGSFPIGTLFAVLALKDQLGGPVTALARTVKDASGNMTQSFEGVAVKIGNVNKLIRDFSGLPMMNKAEEMAAAVTKIGGAAKLTESEMSKVNAVVNEAIRKYQALGQEAPKHLIDLAIATTNIQRPTDEAVKKLTLLQTVQQHVRTEAAGLLGNIKNLALGFFTGQAALDAFYAAGRAVVQFFKDAVQQAIEAERTQKQLTAALRAQGVAFPEVLSHFDALADKYQQTTVHSAGAIKQIEALLVQVGGVLPREMDRALEATTNLAAGLGIDLTAAATMVAKGFEDNFSSLQKVGVQIDTTRAKSEGMTYVLDQIQARFSGQARAEVESYAGQVQQLANAWDDLKEAVGQAAIDTGVLQTVIIGARVAVALLNLEVIRFNAAMQALKEVGPGPGFLLAFNRHMEEAAEKARLMTQEIENIGTAMDRFDLAGRRLSPQQEAYWKGIEDAAKKAGDQVERSITQIADAISGRALARDVQLFNAAFARESAKGTVVLRETLEALRPLVDRGGFPKLSAELRELALRYIILPSVADDVVLSFDVLKVNANGVAAAVERAGNKGQAMGETMRAAFRSIVTNIGPAHDVVRKFGQSVDKVLGGPPLATFGQRAGDFFKNDLPDVILRSIQGGGDAYSAVGAAIGGFIFGEKGIGKTLEGWASKLPGMLGGLVSSFIPAAGMALGSVIARGLSALGTRLFGNSTRDAREQFADQLGFSDLAALYEKLQTMGARGQQLADIGAQVIGRNDEAANRRWMEDVERFFDTAEASAREFEERMAALRLELQEHFADLLTEVDKFGGVAPRELQPFIDQLLEMNGLTAEQKLLLQDLAGDPSLEALKDAADRLGVSFEHMGQEFRQAQISQQALQVVRDLELLAGSGAHMDGVLADASERISQLVQDAIDAGAALPETLRPYIEKLIEMGKLVGPDGELVTNIGQLSFADIPDDALTAIKDILEQIRDILQHDIPQAAEDAARAMEEIPPPPSADDIRRARKRGEEIPDVPSFDVGTGGYYLRRGGLANVHAGEAVTPRSDVPDLAADIAKALGPRVGGGDAVQPIVNVYIGARKFEDYTTEVVIRKLERNDSGGAPVGVADRARKALGVS